MAGNKNSGRKGRSQQRAYAELNMAEAGVLGADYVKRVNQGIIKPHEGRLRSAFFAYDQLCGRARQSHDISAGLSGESQDYITKLVELRRELRDKGQ